MNYWRGEKRYQEENLQENNSTWLSYVFALYETAGADAPSLKRGPCHSSLCTDKPPEPTLFMKCTDVNLKC